MRLLTSALRPATVLLLSVFSALTACGGAPERKADGDAGPVATPAASLLAASPTPQEFVRVSISETSVAAGGVGEAEVRLHVAEGFHVNANPPSEKAFIPTQLDASAAGGIEPGKPAYPAALTKKFGFSEKPLKVYEGETAIKLPLRAGAASVKGRHSLPAKVRVQPCNDEVCFPPVTIETSIPVTVH